MELTDKEIRKDTLLAILFIVISGLSFSLGVALFLIAIKTSILAVVLSLSSIISNGFVVMYWVNILFNLYEKKKSGN